MFKIDRPKTDAKRRKEALEFRAMINAKIEKVKGMTEKELVDFYENMDCVQAAHINKVAFNLTSEQNLAFFQKYFKW